MKPAKLALLALFVPTLVFALSPKYKQWASSPQAYFMTRAERAQWNSIVTDADAEKFINDFVAGRGAGFADMVADRATNADKYLTIGKKPASQTLRGKVIVLLGPPTAIKTETKKGRVDRAAPVGGYSVGDGGRSGGGMGVSVGDMMQAADQSGMSGKQSYIEYTLTYAGEGLPAAFAQGATIKIDVDPNSGEDWAPDSAAQKQLDQLFEAAAAARAAAAKPAVP